MLDSYHNYTELMDELDYLSENYHDISSLYSLGQTHEDRDLTVIQISQGVKQVTLETDVIRPNDVTLFSGPSLIEAHDKTDCQHARQ